MWIVILALISISAFAQFDPLAPTNLIPNVQITCKTNAIFSTVEMKIDVQSGTASQVMGDKKYIYKFDNFIFQKSQGEGNVSMSLKGSLDHVISTTTGEILKSEINSSNFEFTSKLPVKNGKKFTAKSFQIASDVKFPSGGSFKIDDNSTNATKCVLDKGGPAIKDMNQNTKMKISANYPKPSIDDSDRGIQLKNPLNPTPSPTLELKTIQE